jgi:hypothetical protein
VVAIVRQPAGSHRVCGAEKCIALDISQARDVSMWLPCLAGVGAVVNCAGVLQDSPRDSTSGVHVDGPAALFAACEQAGVRLVVQLSAAGVDRGAATPSRAPSSPSSTS